MAKILDFEIKGLKTSRTDNGEVLLSGNLYYCGKKVGDVQEMPDMEPPMFTLPLELEAKWREALDLFRKKRLNAIEMSSPLPKSFIECELFYYVIAVKEWERLLKRESKKQKMTLVVFEQLDQELLCRTGGYKVYVTSEPESFAGMLETLPKLGDNNEEITWAMSTFADLEEFDIKKETSE